MEELTDDALLLVLRLLPTRDLLNLRLVCKRLRDLALHPDAWRHRKEEDWTDEGGGRFRAVLRLAPCVHSLGLCSAYAMRSNDNATLVTHCAARHLNLFVMNTKGGFYLWKFVEALRRQRRLGRLRSLRLILGRNIDRFHSDYSDCLAELVWEINCIEKLVSLVVVVHDAATLMPVGHLVPASVAESTLTEFCYRRRRIEPFVEYMLERHAQTLKDVRLSTPEDPADCVLPAKLLADIVQLEKLDIAMQIDMELLAQCSRLRTLILQIGMDGPDQFLALKHTETFLMRAEHLREVKLSYFGGAEGREADLILRLASGKSKVKYLEIDFDVGYTQYVPNGPRLLEPLAKALPSMPHLIVLVVDSNVNPEFLSAITPASAPKLKQLNVRLAGCCVHNAVHRPEVQGLLRRNPALHLGTLVAGLPRELVLCSEEEGNFCYKPCHNIPKRTVYDVGFHTHTEDCGLHGAIYGCGDTGFIWLKLDLEGEVADAANASGETHDQENASGETADQENASGEINDEENASGETHDQENASGDAHNQENAL